MNVYIEKKSTRVAGGGATLWQLIIRPTIGAVHLAGFLLFVSARLVVSARRVLQPKVTDEDLIFAVDCSNGRQR